MKIIIKTNKGVVVLIEVSLYMYMHYIVYTQYPIKRFHVLV